MPRMAPPDIARFKANKGLVNDYFEYNADAVREKRTVLAASKLFEQMAWLCLECRRLGGKDVIEDMPRFLKIERFVARVCEEQAASIASGQFVKVRADIFMAWRFLVRALEATLKSVLDAEDQFDLGGRALDAEASERIVLDLEDGLGDDEDEPPRPKRRAVARPPAAAAAARVSGLGTGPAAGDDDLPGGDDLTENAGG